MRTITINKFYGITADGVQITDSTYLEVITAHQDDEGNTISSEYYFGKADAVTLSRTTDSLNVLINGTVAYQWLAGDYKADATPLNSAGEAYDYFRLAIAIYE